MKTRKNIVVFALLTLALVGLILSTSSCKKEEKKIGKQPDGSVYAPRI